MRIGSIRRWVVVAGVSSVVLVAGLPAKALPPPTFSSTAYGIGVDGIGNRLEVTAGDNFFTGGGGTAFVRLANGNGAAAVVALTCVIIDTRPGFHFMYASGKGSDGRNFFIGVFDNSGFNRPGPYDAIYTQTSAVNGPCGVAAGSSYPIGWYPVSQGDFSVLP